MAIQSNLSGNPRPQLPNGFPRMNNTSSYTSSPVYLLFIIRWNGHIKIIEIKLKYINNIFRDLYFHHLPKGKEKNNFFKQIVFNCELGPRTISNAQAVTCANVFY